MLYRSDIDLLLLEGLELICTTYETERELIKVCANSHEVLNVLYIGVYDDVSFEADDGLEVFDGDMVYRVIRQNKEVYAMDKIYNMVYDMVSNIPFNGNAVIYSNLSIEYTTNDDGWIYDHNDNNVKPIFNLNLSESYWLDYFISHGVNLRDDVYNDNYEWIILDLADEYSELINETINNYIEGK